ncbi:hypothetical protein [Roseovarius sp.]|uniref:hypothetical protein n=1 Tax=Roseovarius sp. TaxID=1486281 RepID=UPI003D128D3F
MQIEGLGNSDEQHVRHATIDHEASQSTSGSLWTFSAEQDVPKLNRLCYRQTRPYFSSSDHRTGPRRNYSEMVLRSAQLTLARKLAHIRFRFITTGH